MKLNNLYCESINFRVVAIDPEDEWELAEKADMVSKATGIRTGRKDTTFVAVDAGDQDKVIGAIYDSIINTEEGMEYSFDVVVDPAFQRSGVGSALIDAAIRKYRELAQDLDNLYAKVWVINPILVSVLERRGFELESGRDWHPNEPFMVYYGR